MAHTELEEIEWASGTVVPLELYDGSERLGLASAFFWREPSGLFLVSAWHCFSGREPHSGQSTDKKNYRVPDRVAFSCLADDGSGRATAPLQLPLSRDGVALWRMHPSGQKIDVAVLPVEALPRGAIIDAINDPTADGVVPLERLVVRAGCDAFVLGYPLELQPTGVVPVWKRGSVATEPALDADGLPQVWIDATSRPGMSGAPVFVQGYVAKPVHGMIPYRPRLAFLGVYSGRPIARMSRHQRLQPELGVVWKAHTITETILNGCPGDWTA